MSENYTVRKDGDMAGGAFCADLAEFGVIVMRERATKLYFETKSVGVSASKTKFNWAPLTLDFAFPAKNLVACEGLFELDWCFEAGC